MTDTSVLPAARRPPAGRCRSWLLAAVFAAAAWPAISGAAPAGRVIFATGQVSAVDAGGERRRLARGAVVFSGDTVVTGVGRAQLRFSDGGYVSLVPSTEFQIEDYSYAEQAKEERGFFKLLKGGLRALTGAIGKRAREAYRMTTPVATIGIRGTWFSAALDAAGKLLVSVGYDPDDPTAVVISNGAGELVLRRGENAEVESAETAPRVTDRQVVSTGAPGDAGGDADVSASGGSQSEPQTPSVEEPVFVAGDERGQDGTPVIVAKSSTEVVRGLIGAISENATVPPPGIESDPSQDLSLVLKDSRPIGGLGRDVAGFPGADKSNELGGAVIDLPAVLDAADASVRERFQKFVAGANPKDLALLKANPAQVADLGRDGPIGWWRWTGGSILFFDVKPDGSISTEIDDLRGSQSMHFVVGDIPGGPLPRAGTGTYRFTGGTRSTSESGASTGEGVTAGTLVVHFAPPPFVTVDMRVKHNPTYRVSGTVDMQGPYFSDRLGGAMTATTTSLGSRCNPVCRGVRVDGFLSGPTRSPPSRAGLTYIIPESDRIHGAAAFRRLDLSR